MALAVSRRKRPGIRDDRGGVAIHALSMRVVSTALPIVVTEIGGLRFFAWTTTVAVVTAIWGAAFSASLVRLRGLRDAYRISLVLFAGGSVICASSPNMGVFLAGRFFQGLGGRISNRVGLRDDPASVQRESAHARYCLPIWYLGCGRVHWPAPRRRSRRMGCLAMGILD